MPLVVGKDGWLVLTITWLQAMRQTTPEKVRKLLYHTGEEVFNIYLALAAEVWDTYAQLKGKSKSGFEPVSNIEYEFFMFRLAFQ